MLGDAFLSDLNNEYLWLKSASSNTDKNSELLYLEDYFNVHALYKNQMSSNFAVTRILNAWTEEINIKETRLSRYLLVILDGDIIPDVQDLTCPDVTKMLTIITNWLVRQISVILHQKWQDLYDKKPGAVHSTTVIYVRMLHWIRWLNENTSMYAIHSLWPRYNDALNDAVVKVNECILTINSCNHYEDFTHLGQLSTKEKRSFWHEIDDLLRRFHLDKIKLLPNPKNPPRAAGNDKSCHWNNSALHQPLHSASMVCYHDTADTNQYRCRQHPYPPHPVRHY